MSLENPTAKQITCECGYIATGATDDDVVDRIEDHFRRDHPRLFAQLTREEIATLEIVE
jgi:predicted small metal-binding protein